MRILGVCLSPRKGGNSEILLREALRGAEECEAIVELLLAGEMKIEPCTGCGHCREEGICNIDDDMQTVYTKLIETDGVIFSTPVYFWSIPGGAKSFLDRTFALRFPWLKLMNKVGAAITVATSSGNMNALGVFNNLFISNHMITSDFIVGYAAEKGTVRKHKHAMYGAYELGRLIGLMISNGCKYPEEFNRPIYTMVKEKYGIHMCPFED